LTKNSVLFVYFKTTTSQHIHTHPFSGDHIIEKKKYNSILQVLCTDAMHDFLHSFHLLVHVQQFLCSRKPTLVSPNHMQEVILEQFSSNTTDTHRL
jgi:hypothetical protein